MVTLKRLAHALIVLLLTAACTSHRAHRLSANGDALEATVSPTDLADPAQRERLDTSGIEVHEDYRLHFLEFDDQGQLWSTAPFKRLVETLQKEAASPEKPRLTIVLFAHGWQNDARLCNGNVCCFRTFLSRIAADSKIGSARSNGMLRPTRVIGIFIGWRGLSATIPPFRALSFYSRKNVAANVGHGELVEVLSFLDQYQKHVNAETVNRCRLVIMGHSFGGAIVYSAIANVLKSRITDARVRTVLGEENLPIEGFGDLVVLANPAFEASLYAPLQELVGAFPSFSPHQNPLLIVLASETDTATRTYFKISRFVGTIFQRTGPRSSRQMLTHTIGNYEPFVTHKASAPVDERVGRGGSLLGVVSDCECKLPMSEVDVEAVDHFLSILRMGRAEAAKALVPTLCPGHEQLGVVSLDCVVTRPPGLPLWVIRASNEVVSGHSGFFTRPVTDIVRNLVVRRFLAESIAATPAPPTPAP